MVDQKLREKVIKGLECCSTNRLRREDCETMDCVYLDLEGHGCIHQLIRDAFALLKAEKPDCAAANRDAGGCLGYCHSESDDEPIDICKECKEYTGNRERW